MKKGVIWKMRNKINNVHEMPEKTRRKFMWTVVVFLMFIVFCVWWIEFTSNRHDSGTDFSLQSSSFLSGYKEKIGVELDGFNRQKSIMLKEVSEMVKKEIKNEESNKKIEKIISDYIASSNLIEEKSVSDLKLRSIERLDNKLWYVEYQQYYKSVLVNESNVSFFVDEAKKSVVSHKSNFDPDIEIDVEPKITDKQAYKTAAENLNSKNLKLKSSQLVVYRDISKDAAEYYLVWKLNIFSSQPSHNYYYYVDAKTGRVVLYYDLI